MCVCCHTFVGSFAAWQDDTAGVAAVTGLHSIAMHAVCELQQQPPASRLSELQEGSAQAALLSTSAAGNAGAALPLVSRAAAPALSAMQAALGFTIIHVQAIQKKFPQQQLTWASNTLS